MTKTSHAAIRFPSWRTIGPIPNRSIRVGVDAHALVRRIVRANAPIFGVFGEVAVAMDGDFLVLLIFQTHAWFQYSTRSHP